MKQVACPHCHSYKTVDRKLNWTLGGTLLTLFSLPWIVLVFPVVFVIAGLIIVLCGVALPRASRFRCRACAFVFPKPI